MMRGIPPINAARRCIQCGSEQAEAPGWSFLVKPQKKGPFCSRRCLDVHSATTDQVAQWTQLRQCHSERLDQNMTIREWNDHRLDLFNAGLIDLSEMNLVNPL